MVATLAAGHRRVGHEVHVAAVLTADEPEHPFLENLRAAGVHVHTLTVPTRAYRKEQLRISALCRRLAPAVVHTHGYRPDVVDAPVARHLGVPVVSTVHGFTRTGLRGRAYEWAQRRSYRAFDAVVAVSAPQVPELRAAGVPVERLHLIRNAAADSGQVLPAAVARQRLGAPPDRKHVGWVGRVSPEKGADLFLEALGHLSDLPIHGSIIGTGSDLASLKKRAERTLPGVAISWHGAVPEAGRLFSAFDVFVLSSRTEGTPIVLFEAMAAGVPIVAATVGGVGDVVSSNEAALVEPRDPVALAAAIRAVLADPDLARRRVQAAARRLADEFGVDPWLAAYEALYRRIARPAAEAALHAH